MMLAGHASHVLCVNFTHWGPVRGRVQRCFEFSAHVDGIAVFGDGRQWLKVSSGEKVLGSLSHKGRATA